MEPYDPETTQDKVLALINVTNDILSHKSPIMCHKDDLNPNSIKQLGFKLGFKLRSEPFEIYLLPFSKKPILGKNRKNRRSGNNSGVVEDIRS